MKRRFFIAAKGKLVAVEVHYVNGSEALCVAGPGQYRFPGSAEGYTVTTAAKEDTSQLFVRTDWEDWVEIPVGSCAEILPDNSFEVLIQSAIADVTFLVEPFPELTTAVCQAEDAETPPPGTPIH